MKNICTYSFLLFLILIAISSFNCKDFSVPADENTEPYVKIISPIDGAIYNKLDTVTFKSKFLSGTNIVSYDSISWVSDIAGRIANYDFSAMLKSGNHKIKCAVYKKNKTYSSQISLNVKDIFDIDTLLINGNLEIFKIPGAEVNALNLDNDDNPLIGAKNLGLFYRYNKIWENYNKSDDLIDNDIQCIGVDKNNIIYIGYDYYNGVSKQTNNGWRFIDMDASLGGDVHVISFDENNILWTANHDGDITKYENGIWDHLSNLPIDYHHPNELIFDKQKVLWSTSDYGSVSFDGQNWKSLKVNGDLIRALCMAIDQNDVKWFGCYAYDGIIKISKTDTTFFNWRNSSFPASSIFALAIDQNNIPYAGAENGLYKFDGLKWTEVSFPPLESKFITNLKVDSKNNIWFTSHSYFGRLKQ